MNIAVMGDSMSTFTGWSNNPVNRNDPTSNYYPANSVFKTVDCMWWMQVYSKIGGTQIVSVDAIAGSCVGYYSNTDSGHLGPSWCFDTDIRSHDLGSSDVNSGKRPDAIFFLAEQMIYVNLIIIPQLLSIITTIYYIESTTSTHIIHALCV